MRCSADVSCRTLSLAAMPCSRCETATEPKVGGSNPSGHLRARHKSPAQRGFCRLGARAVRVIATDLLSNIAAGGRCPDGISRL